MFKLTHVYVLQYHSAKLTGDSQDVTQVQHLDVNLRVVVRNQVSLQAMKYPPWL